MVCFYLRFPSLMSDHLILALFSFAKTNLTQHLTQLHYNCFSDVFSDHRTSFTTKLQKSYFPMMTLFHFISMSHLSHGDTTSK